MHAYVATSYRIIYEPFSSMHTDFRLILSNMDFKAFDLKAFSWSRDTKSLTHCQSPTDTYGMSYQSIPLQTPVPCCWMFLAPQVQVIKASLKFVTMNNLCCALLFCWLGWGWGVIFITPWSARIGQACQPTVTHLEWDSRKQFPRLKSALRDAPNASTSFLSCYHNQGVRTPCHNHIIEQFTYLFEKKIPHFQISQSLNCPIWGWHAWGRGWWFHNTLVPYQCSV